MRHTSHIAFAVPDSLAPSPSRHALQQPLWGLSISALDLPQDLRQFYEVQRIIVVDAVRCEESMGICEFAKKGRASEGQASYVTTEHFNRQAGTNLHAHTVPADIRMWSVWAQ